jgi:hypothetical protein
VPVQARLTLNFRLSRFSGETALAGILKVTVLQPLAPGLPLLEADQPQV